MILALLATGLRPEFAVRTGRFRRRSRSLMTKIIVTVYALAMICAAAGVRADDKPDNVLPARVATHHSIIIGGARLDYEAIAETLAVTDAQGATTASIF